MADISKIKTPNGTTYDIVDREARRIIAASQIINSDSGAIVSFSDGADDIPFRSLSVDLEPIQDLHGYDHPWPAGGGVNLLQCNADVREKTINGVAWKINDDGSVTVSGTATAESTLRYAMDAEQRFNGNYKFYAFSGSISTSDFHGGIKIGEKWFSVYANGTKQNLADTDGTLSEVWFQVKAGKTVNATFYPMIYSAEESYPTEWSPYSNICPISGRTGADIEHTGVNVWDEEWEVGGINNSTGEKESASSIIRSKNYIQVLPNTTYYFKCSALASGNGTLFYYDANKRFISINYKQNNTFVTPSDAYYMLFKLGSGYGTAYNHDVSINYPSTDTSYHAYTGETISVTFPTEAGTVYGGTLDVTTGLLTVDRAMVDLGTLTWKYEANSSNKHFYVSGKTFAIPKYRASLLSEMYIGTKKTYASINNLEMCVDNSVTFPILRVKNDAYTDAETFKTAMNGVKLVYELATPQTYHLTPQEVRTLLGTNNVWSDADSIFVEYDTKNSVVAFTSSDVADGDASSWTTVTKVASGEKRSSLFAKMSQMFKNIRYLHKLLGTTDISSIGDGTVTGGLSSLDESQQAQKQLYIQQLKDLCLFAEIANGS